MERQYKKIHVSELTRGSEVKFRYLPGGQVNDVVGWVDKISKNSIYVGNESHLETTGLEIYHVKRYKVDKIECLEEKLLF